MKKSTSSRTPGFPDCDSRPLSCCAGVLRPLNNVTHGQGPRRGRHLVNACWRKGVRPKLATARGAKEPNCLQPISSYPSGYYYRREPPAFLGAAARRSHEGPLSLWDVVLVVTQSKGVGQALQSLVTFFWTGLCNARAICAMNRDAIATPIKGRFYSRWWTATTTTSQSRWKQISLKNPFERHLNTDLILDITDFL